jgi:flagellar biosynthetic protein FliR
MEPYATADQVWAGGLIFARIGALLLTLPGIGEPYVPPRIRLSLALLISLVLWPVVAPGLPPLPQTVSGMSGWVIREVVTGLMVGYMLRLFMSALATAGEIVSLQTTLSFAQTANPLQAQPGSTLAAFLMLLGTVLVFATNTHHLFLAGLVGSYEVIAPMNPLMLGDFTQMAVRTVASSFMLGVQLAAPVIVFALIFNLASGLVARVMPAFQVFFAAAPLSVILGLSVFALSLGVLGTVFIDRYRALARVFTAGAGGFGG